MNSTHLFAVKRALQDVKELEGIAGVDIAKSDDPLTINLDYSPAGLATTEDSKFHFCILQQAVSKLGVVGQPVDIVHAVEAFSGLTQLQCTQCALTCQSVLQLDPSMELMSSLTSLAIIRCTSKPLFGPTGLFAALKALPHLEELEFEPATGMLWAVYDNTGSTEFAGNPFGTDGVLNLPPEIPRPVPDDCSSIWTALGSITQLRSLSVAVPLFAMAYAHRDLGWHGWSAASRIADLAFSARGLAAMPRLESLSLDLQHGMMRTVRPDEGMVPAAQRQLVLDSYCGWQLPECRLKSFSLSGVGLGSRQLNYQKSTQEFWGSLEQLTIGHSIVADALQATARKTLAGLACNVAYPNLAPLEDAPPQPGHSAEPPLVSWWEGLMQDRP